MSDKTDIESGEMESANEEHFEALSFGWKMAEGLRNNVDTKRLKAYADWFYQNYMKPHLTLEEEFVFPILGLDNVRVKKALANHRRLKRLFNNSDEIYKSLNRIEDEIGRYVRFEERILYKQIREAATSEQLQEIDEAYRKIEYSGEEWHDKFWK